MAAMAAILEAREVTVREVDSIMGPPAMGVTRDMVVDMVDISMVATTM